MLTPTKDTISAEEFDRRLGKSNERLRQELSEAQQRVQRLEELVSRKEAFSKRLDQILYEVEREEKEIAALERGLRSSRKTVRQSSPPSRARG